MSGYYIQGVRICQDTIYRVSEYVRILHIQCVGICQYTIYNVYRILCNMNVWQ